MAIPFYDPTKTYEENFHDGPYGVFADGKIFKNTSNPSYNVFGQKVYLPFGIPAGPLLNGKFIKAAMDKGFDIVVYKTVRSIKYPCNAWPNILSVKVDGNLTPELANKGLIANNNYYSDNLSITNSFGVPSFSPEFWQKDMADCVKYAKEGQMVVGSFQGTKNAEGDRRQYIKDFSFTAKSVQETGVKVLEANLSCPNEGTGNLLCFDIDTSKEVVLAIRREVGDAPLVIKISYFKDKEMLRKFLKEIGGLVEGISSINTIPAKVYDGFGKQALPGEGRLVSGICGSSIKWAGLEMVKQLKKFKIESGFSFKIFGVGGVTTSSDYFDYKGVGADTVMSATGAMWDPYLAQEIKSNKISL